MGSAQELRFGWRKSILFSLVLITLFFGTAELGVRGWAYFLRDDAERFDLATQTFVLVPGEHRTAMGTATINSQGFVGGELKPEGPDLWRIAAIGDSCTYGGGHKSDTYPAQLQEDLERLERPGLRYEVVNAGVSGLDSELALRRLRTRVLPLEPDVVTIYIGWNDLMKVDPFAVGVSGRWSGAARLIDRLWLTKGLRKLFFFYVRPYLSSPGTGPQSHTGRLVGFRPVFYEDNLRNMIASTCGFGSRPVLITLPTVVRQDMTLEDVWKTRVFFPYFPSAYSVLDLLDLIRAYNESIRRVSAEEDVPVVDLARAFEALEDPTPYFLDTMHTTPEGAKLIARLLFSDLDQQGVLDPPKAERRTSDGTIATPSACPSMEGGRNRR